MAFLKSLVPTDRIFQVGLHMHGACHLPAPWNGDEDAASASASASESEGDAGHGGSGGAGGGNASAFYYSRTDAERNGVSYEAVSGEQVEFSFTHPFDATVWAADAKLIDPLALGIIYHFVNSASSGLPDSSPNANMTGTNDYVIRFFPDVAEKLNERGLLFVPYFRSRVEKRVPYKDRPDEYFEFVPFMKAHIKDRNIFP
jgi:hypothetical protein